MKDLPAIEATYTELATRLDRKLDAAREQGDGAAVAWAEKQQLINDSAYFILVWGQLEVRIDEVCEAAVRQRRDSDDWSLRRAWDAFDPDNLRVRFEDRVALVLDRSNRRATPTSGPCATTAKGIGWRTAGA